LSGTIQSEFLSLYRQGFTDSRPRVVEEKKQRSITPGVRRAWIYGRDDGPSLFWFQVWNGAENGFLAGDGENPPILIRTRHVIPQQMLSKAPESRQTAIASSRGVAPLRFGVVKKGKYCVGPDIVEREVGDGAFLALRGKQEK
jgi:hypothetical protein